MNFTPSDEQINDYRRIEAQTISETVSKQTPLGIIRMLRSCADDVRAPGPYPNVRNIKPIDCDKLYEFLNAIADKLECLAGLRKEECTTHDMNNELEKAKAKIREGCIEYLLAMLKATGSAEVSVLMLAKSIEQICTSFTDDDFKVLEEEGGAA